MKVLIVSPYYSGVGGLQQYSYRIAVGLHDAGVDTTVVTSSRVPQRSGPMVITLPQLTTVSNTPFSLRWFGSIKRIIKDLDPDIVNGHLPVPYMADVAARECSGHPFVLTYHNDAVGITPFTKLLVRSYYDILGKGTIRLASRIITTSQRYAELSPYLKRFSQKIAVVPPGVDLATFNPNVYSGFLKDTYSLEGSIILFVGQLSKTHRHKGLSILIRALRHLDPSTTLVVVGGGNWFSHYKADAENAGVADRVVFAGIISEEDLPLYYRGADLTVLPTYTDAEGFGMVLAEANACGRPVIGTNVGGIPSLIQDQHNGLLVEPGDLRGLVQAISIVLSDGKLAKTLGQNGFEKIRSGFTWDLAVSRTMKVYDGLIYA
ncbi:MAG: glycosyltransferase family 4 protein [Halobacteriota archaeon]